MARTSSQPPKVLHRQWRGVLTYWAVLVAASTASTASSAGATDCGKTSLKLLVANPKVAKCTKESGYTFVPPTTAPSEDQMDTMCKSANCQAFLQAMMATNPHECNIPGGTLQLRADLLDKVMGFCKNATERANHASTQPTPPDNSPTPTPTNAENAVTNTPANNDPATNKVTSENTDPKSREAKSTESSSKSTHRSSTSLILIVILPVVAGGLLVAAGAFFVWRRKHRSQGDDDDLGEELHVWGDKTPHANVEYSLAADVEEAGPVSEPTDHWAGASSGALHGSVSLDRPRIDSMRVSLEKLTQHERIGQGAYAEVFRGFLDGRVVAIKRVSPEVVARWNTDSLRSLLTEVRLLVPLNHPNLVQLIGVAWQTQRPMVSTFCVVYEFMNRGDLRQLLVEFDKSGRARGFDRQKLGIALDVASGLKYLHDQTPKVIHRDLKSRNILLNRKLQAKVTDFGIPRFANEETMTMTAGAGTNLWMAPEVLLGQRYNVEADLFSFGVVLSELDTHLLPYAEAIQRFETEHGHPLGEYAILQNVTSGAFRAGFTNTTEEAKVVALARQCLDLDPRKRPSAAEVCCQLDKIRDQWRGA